MKSFGESNVCWVNKPTQTGDLQQWDSLCAWKPIYLVFVEFWNSALATHIPLTTALTTSVNFDHWTSRRLLSHEEHNIGTCMCQIFFFSSHFDQKHQRKACLIRWLHELWQHFTHKKFQPRWPWSRQTALAPGATVPCQSRDHVSKSTQDIVDLPALIMIQKISLCTLNACAWKNEGTWRRTVPPVSACLSWEQWKLPSSALLSVHSNHFTFSVSN